MPLNLRQRKFVAEYLKNPNATKAALKAGYSKKTAHSIGSENLQKPEIAALLQVSKLQVAEDARLTVGDHLRTLATLRDAAERAGQMGAAVTAETQRGKVCGLYVEKVDVTTGGKALSSDERSGRLEAVLAILAARAKRP